MRTGLHFVGEYQINDNTAVYAIAGITRAKVEGETKIINSDGSTRSKESENMTGTTFGLV